MFWDIPKCSADHFRAGAVEKVKDGLISVNKYEGGMICMNPPWVIVFANIPPPLHEFTDDRFIVYDLRTDEEKLQEPDQEVQGQSYSTNFKRRKLF